MFDLFSIFEDDLGPTEAAVEHQVDQSEWRFINGHRVPTPVGMNTIDFDLGTVLGGQGFDTTEV